MFVHIGKIVLSHLQRCTLIHSCDIDNTLVISLGLFNICSVLHSSDAVSCSKPHDIIVP